MQPSNVVQLDSAATLASFDVGTRLNFLTSPLITGLVLSGLTVGTGGAITTSSLAEFTAQARTSVAWEYTRSLVARETEDGIVLGTSEKLVAIQHYLGLNTTELAQVLYVSRPTVYSWIRGEQDPHLSNLERITVLYNFAKSWERICPKSLGTLVRQPVVGSESLVQMLSAEHINAAQVSDALQRLARIALSRDLPRVKSVLFDLPEEIQRTRLSEEFGM